MKKSVFSFNFLIFIIDINPQNFYLILFLKNRIKKMGEIYAIQNINSLLTTSLWRILENFSIIFCTIIYLFIIYSH